ncbi:winged helix-turn-helix domain-containing protein [Lysinibacter cavernae]|uniref:Winged helix-turn-helix domain-containing protein n=1 Tax=Lysinibacter cavernae TaxID=1640652 RepID=A0A7X5R0S7_9MICO|nr:crosslink repair DNA glycosylase YcaQ family protein [Lysinibacter cavernae]NIH53486.1 hypothetical protein [Lysinibacter cavernae]
MTDSLSLAQARRIALEAQQLAKPVTLTQPAPRARPAATTRKLNTTLSKLHLLQIDSVNVFERSHYLPILARQGAYDRAAADQLLLTGGPYVEYWAHEAAIIPQQSWPLFRWRMNERHQKDTSEAGKWAADHQHVIERVRQDLASRGPSLVREIEGDVKRAPGGWWEWSDVKRAVEFLFGWGEVTAAGRQRFERRYALTEQVLPAEIIDRHVARPDAIRQLAELGARAHGVGTAHDIADYFRLPLAETKTAINELQDEGILQPVTVERWVDTAGRQLPAWRHRDATLPRAATGAALLSPFDPVVWFRPRAERLFNFHYRIEIYTPEPKRVFGYYSLPVLVGDQLVGRVDLKNDRKAGVLRVQSAWQEPGAPADTGERVYALLEAAAAWQDNERIEVTGKGNLRLPGH